MVASRPFLVKSLKGDWDPECFQDNKNFLPVIYRISFTFCLQSFSWFCLVDLEIYMVVLESIEYLFNVCDITRIACFMSILFALILASSKLCNSRTKQDTEKW